MNRAQVSPFPVVQLLLGALAFGAVIPYYAEYSVPAEAGLGGYVVESVLFVLGIFPWLVTHPSRLLMALPLLAYLLLLFSRPIVRAKPM